MKNEQGLIKFLVSAQDELLKEASDYMSLKIGTFGNERINENGYSFDELLVIHGHVKNFEPILKEWSKINSANCKWYPTDRYFLFEPNFFKSVFIRLGYIFSKNLFATEFYPHGWPGDKETAGRERNIEVSILGHSKNRQGFIENEKPPKVIADQESLGKMPWSSLIQIHFQKYEDEKYIEEELLKCAFDNITPVTICHKDAADYYFLDFKQFFPSINRDCFLAHFAPDKVLVNPWARKLTEDQEDGLIEKAREIISERRLLLFW